MASYLNYFSWKFNKIKSKLFGRIYLYNFKTNKTYWLSVNANGIIFESDKIKVNVMSVPITIYEVNKLKTCFT